MKTSTKRQKERNEISSKCENFLYLSFCIIESQTYSYKDNQLREEFKLKNKPLNRVKTFYNQSPN